MHNNIGLWPTMVVIFLLFSEKYNDEWWLLWLFFMVNQINVTSIIQLLMESQCFSCYAMTWPNKCVRYILLCVILDSNHYYWNLLNFLQEFKNIKIAVFVLSVNWILFRGKEMLCHHSLSSFLFFLKTGLQFDKEMEHNNYFVSCSFFIFFHFSESVWRF